MPVPLSLQDRLRDGNVIPFVGAGVSMDVLDRVSRQPIFPSWRQLLEAAADRLEQETKNNDARLVRSFLNVNPPEFLEAASRARKALGPIWYDVLKDSLDIKFETIDPASLELARRIWRLGSNLVITTNYDQVLKWACLRQDDLQSWDIEAPVEQARLLRQNLQGPVIWHLHGRISNAANLILSPDGYALLYPQTDGDVRKVQYEAALQTLRNQLASKSFLFVGFSLEDEYFGTQLKSLNEIYKGAIGPHYALVREEQAERVRVLNIEPVTFSDFGEPLIALMSELETAVNSRAEPASRPSVIPDYGPHQPVFYVPFPQKGAQIVGQHHVLEAVRKQLTEGRRTAIGQTAAFRGLGGLGKTQMAIEYAYRYRDEYPNGVIWLTADQNIDSQLTEIAEKARWIAPESEHKHKIQIAQQRIRSYSDCLIIFDNLEDRAVIDPYLPDPEAKPHILVTSRIDHADFDPVSLELLDEKLARELLVKEARRQPENEEEEKAVEGIIGFLGGLPLALELAGAYLGHRRAMTFQQYYEVLAKDLKSALPKSVSSFTKHEADLYSTLRLSEGLLLEEERLRDVLNLLTWSGSAPMSTELISHLLIIQNDGALAGALALGAELRLLQRSKESDSYSLHRLVGEVRRAEIKLEERLGWVDTVCSRLGNWFQEKRRDFSQLMKFELEIDHLKKWQENAARFVPSHSSRLMWLQAYPAYHRGHYVKARSYVIEAQRVFEQQGDTNLELKANLLNDLAFTSFRLGDTEFVLANHCAALMIRRDLFGDSHSDVAISLDAIGVWYGKQGNLQLALQYLEQALAMRRAVFGEKHPDIAGSLNNLAKYYGEHGNLRQALKYLEDALAMQHELFGERHPDLARSVHNIGSCYGRQGDRGRALLYLQQALTMRRELFGDRHPDIANSLNSIGTWYGEKRDLELAGEYLKQALAMRRDLFGEKHPDVAASLSNLGSWYSEQGDVQRGIEYGEQALAMRKQLFGEVHPEVATSFANLGTWYGKLGDARGLEYSEQGLAMRRALFGEIHPDIANSLHNVGAWYTKLGNVRRGLDYSQQAFTMYQELLGERHPSTIEAAKQVAIIFAKFNRRKEAYDLVSRFMGIAQGPAREQLKRLEQQLLSQPIQPGFRQPPKSGKRKGKKKRR